MCSEHFAENIKDENNPIPTLFPWKKPEVETPKRPLPKERTIQEAKANNKKQRKQQGVETPSSTSQQTPPTYTSVVLAAVTLLQEKSQSVAIQCCPELTEKAVRASQCCTKLTAKVVQVDGDRTFVYVLLERIEQLESQNTSLRSQLIHQTFYIERFSNSDEDIAYYTGFPGYDTLMTFWHYLGDKVNHLTLWRGRETKITGTPTCHTSERKLKPIDEFVLCLMRLRVGLQITDLAFRFCISPTSVSRILTTWINFLYLEFKAIDFQPSREQIDRDMPVF